MQLTVDIPDEMVPRLRPHENRLARVLELGLEALEDSRPFSDDVEPDPETASWRRAAESFSERALEEDASEPLTPEEILAYAEKTLSAAERAEVEERLALDPDAVDDLLDYQGFENLEPPSPDLALRDDDVRSALGELRGKIAAESAEPKSSAPSGSPGPRPVSFARRLQKQLPYLALAASVILALGSFLNLGSSPNQMTARHVQPFELDEKRGVIQDHDLETGSDWFQLTLPRIVALEGKAGEVVLSTRSGRSIFRSAIEGRAAEGTRVVISGLPKDELRVGDYEVEILDQQGLLLQRFQFSIKEPPAPF